jgi:hypothetical protein
VLFFITHRHIPESVEKCGDHIEINIRADGSKTNVCADGIQTNICACVIQTTNCAYGIQTNTYADGILKIICIPLKETSIYSIHANISTLMRSFSVHNYNKFQYSNQANCQASAIPPY